jgi:hypothetical protein
MIYKNFITAHSKFMAKVVTFVNRQDGCVLYVPKFQVTGTLYKIFFARTSGHFFNEYSQNLLVQVAIFKYP